MSKTTNTLYLPENLHPKVLFQEYPPQGKIKRKRDHIAFILDTIYLIRDKYRIYDESEYVPVSSNALKNMIGVYQKDCIKYLLESKIISTDNKYIIGKKCRGFKILKKPSAKVTPHHITTDAINIKLNENKKSTNLKSSNVTGSVKLRRWYRYLKIDSKSALIHLEKMYNNYEISLESYIVNQRRVKKFNVEKYFHIDHTSMRVHTNFTALKKEIRQYVFIKEDKKQKQTLVNIDIKNSQPYFSLLLFDNDRLKTFKSEIDKQTIKHLKTNVRSTNNNKDNKDNKDYKDYYNKDYITPLIGNKNKKNVMVARDVALYKKLVKEGSLYDMFGLLLDEEDLVQEEDHREYAKKKLFQIIFGNNRTAAKFPETKVFKEHFPTVYKRFSEVKKENHSTLAVLLQFIESELILRRVCGIISQNHPEVPFYTIHDSIVTTEEHEKLITAVLRDVLQESIGIPPSIKKTLTGAVIKPNISIKK